MVRHITKNLLLRGKVEGDIIKIYAYNGLPSHVMYRLSFDELGNIFISHQVGVYFKKYTDIELLCNITYKVHHCQYSAGILSVYKARKPKCVNGLKYTDLTFRR